MLLCAARRQKSLDANVPAAGKGKGMPSSPPVSPVKLPAPPHKAVEPIHAHLSAALLGRTVPRPPTSTPKRCDFDTVVAAPTRVQPIRRAATPPRAVTPTRPASSSPPPPPPKPSRVSSRTALRWPARRGATAGIDKPVAAAPDAPAAHNFQSYARPNPRWPKRRAASAGVSVSATEHSARVAAGVVREPAGICKGSAAVRLRWPARRGATAGLK